jgi:hypothetical protein
MTKKELFYQLRDTPDDMDIVVEWADGGVRDFQVEPITESCDDPTVVGMILAIKEVEH